jgi:hypothetical protein
VEIAFGIPSGAESEAVKSGARELNKMPSLLVIDAGEVVEQRIVRVCKRTWRVATKYAHIMEKDKSIATPFS